jgi:hypothetical protein
MHRTRADAGGQVIARWQDLSDRAGALVANAGVVQIKLELADT